MSDTTTTKRKAPEKKTINPSKRVIHLTVKEQLYIESTTKETEEANLAKLEDKLNKHMQDPNEQLNYDHFVYTLFHGKHPEAKAWRNNPEGIEDPRETTFTFAGIDRPMEPLTNFRRYWNLQAQWERGEMNTTPEHIAWTKYNKAKRNLESKITLVKNRLRTLAEYAAIRDIPVTQIDPLTCVLLKELLAKQSKETKRVRTNNGEDPNDTKRVKSILVPYDCPGGGFATVSITHTTEHFELEDCFVIYDDRKKVIGMIKGNILHFRAPGQLEGFLKSLNHMTKDPAGFFAAMGKLCNMCLICGRDLTDEVSREIGYGPVCGEVFRRNRHNISK